MLEYDDWLINILPRVCLMKHFMIIDSLLWAIIDFYIPLFKVKDAENITTNGMTAVRFGCQGDPRPLCSLESWVASDLWGFKWRGLTFYLSCKGVLFHRVSEGIFQDIELIGLLSHVVFKSDPESLYVPYALTHISLLLSFIHLSCFQENNSVISSLWSPERNLEVNEIILHCW